MAVALTCPPTLAAQAPERFQAVVEWEIGDLDGPMALTLVGSILPVGSRVYVTQPMDRLVRIVADDGSPVGRLGRWGDGPGEFQRVDRIGWIDGRVVVGDVRLQRITSFDLEGNVVETRRSPQLPPAPPLHFATEWHPAVAGRTVLYGTQLIGGDDHPPVERSPGYLIAPDGSVADTLPPIRWGRSVAILRGDGRIRTARLPFNDSSRWAMAPDGTAFVLADDQPSHELTVYRYDIERGRANTFRTRLPSVRVPSSYSDSVQADLIRIHGQGSFFSRRTLERELQLASVVPAAADLFVASEGDIWLKAPNFGSGPDLWRVFTPEGRARMEVEAPLGSELKAADGTSVWAHRRDDLGVSYVQRLRLESR